MYARKIIISLPAAVVFCALGVQETRAANLVWVGGLTDCNWSTASNWSPSQSPDTGDNLTLDSSYPCAVTHVDIDLPKIDGKYMPNDVTMGNGMTMYMDELVGISMCGTFKVTGTVIVDGPGGGGIQTHAVRLGELSGLSGSVLEHKSAATFEGGVRDLDC